MSSNLPIQHSHHHHFDRATAKIRRAVTPNQEEHLMDLTSIHSEAVMSSVLETACETAVERYQALIRVSQKLVSYRSPKELMSDLANDLREVVNFCYLGLGVYDEATHQVHLKLFDACGGKIEAPKLAPEETLTWWVYQHQQELLISDVDSEGRFPAAVDLLRRQGIRSVCTLPLTTVHRRLGGLAVGSKDTHAFTAEEVWFLALVSNQVALAVDAALNFESSQRASEELRGKQMELQNERDRLQLLLDVTNGIVSNLDQREVLRAIAASIRRVMVCDGAGVLLPDGEDQLDIYALDFPESKGLIKEGKLAEQDSPPRTAFLTGKPVVMSRADLSCLDGEKSAVVTGVGIKASCFIPLMSRNRAVGVLALCRLGDASFSQQEVDFLTQIASQLAIAVENASAFRQISELKDQLAREKVYLEDEIRSELNFEEIIGESPALKTVLGQVETVAPTDSTVLIYGETGTGKELIARAIHDHSSRHSNAFVKLNCAAIPTGLLESEMFGHEKGAFTGAIMQRIGRFELAHRGTIFLDEVGEIPLELQPKLLRVLQEREFERLGSTRTLHTDARLIAATNRDLSSLVEEQKFRADLFYRLNVFPIHVPALRERPEDIPLLIRHFVQQFSRRMNKTIRTIPTDTINTLNRYQWPGNIRELQNVIERAVILSKGPALNVPLPDLKAKPSDTGPPRIATLEEAEREHILAALEATNWIVGGPNGAAARLGLNRTTLQFRMRKLGVNRPGRSSALPVSAQ
jgi:formate hydrogenlyase transcriptional activator